MLRLGIWLILSHYRTYIQRKINFINIYLKIHIQRKIKRHKHSTVHHSTIHNSQCFLFRCPLISLSQTFRWEATWDSQPPLDAQISTKSYWGFRHHLGFHFLCHPCTSLSSPHVFKNSIKSLSFLCSFFYSLFLRPSCPSYVFDLLESLYPFICFSAQSLPQFLTGYRMKVMLLPMRASTVCSQCVTAASTTKTIAVVVGCTAYMCESLHCVS